MAVYTPPGVLLMAKTGSVARTDTTATELFTLPKSSTIVYSIVQGTVASDAGTTATVDVGISGNADAIADAVDVKTSGATAILSSGASVGTKLTVDTPVDGIYAESGTASTTGGPWNVTVVYFVN